MESTNTTKQSKASNYKAKEKNTRENCQRAPLTFDTVITIALQDATNKNVRSWHISATPIYFKCALNFFLKEHYHYSFTNVLYCLVVFVDMFYNVLFPVCDELRRYSHVPGRTGWPNVSWSRTWRNKRRRRECTLFCYCVVLSISTSSSLLVVALLAAY